MRPFRHSTLFINVHSFPFASHLKDTSNITLGELIKMVKEGPSFQNKPKLIQHSTAITNIRKRAVHRITKSGNHEHTYKMAFETELNHDALLDIAEEIIGKLRHHIRKSIEDMREN